jgi:hypothetical protein
MIAKSTPNNKAFSASPSPRLCAGGEVRDENFKQSKGLNNGFDF